jgi:YVTN family beta-propeller protein
MNADTGAVVGTIAGFSKQHGVALATEFNRGFISDGNTSTVTIFDMKTLEKVGEVKTAPGTDAVNYDPMSKRVFTVNAGSSPSSTVIDPKTGQVIKTIELPGTPAQLAWDGKGMIYTNIVTKNEVAAIDTRTLEVKSLWPTAPSGNPTAIAIDREHRRLFSVGRDPQILVVMDADNGKVIQSFPVTEGTDAVAYDPETKLIFVAAREGNIHIFHEDTPDKYSVVDTVKSEYGAKTMGLDLTTHNVFVDTSDFGPAPAPTAENAHPRRPAILGTFHVLVYGR